MGFFFSAKLSSIWCVLNKNDNDNKGNLRALAEGGRLITNSASVHLCTNMPIQC